MHLCQASITPEWGGNGKDQEEKGVITAKRNYSITGEKRLDNEINLPSSLPYRRKHFKKLLLSSLKNKKPIQTSISVIWTKLLTPYCKRARPKINPRVEIRHVFNST